MLRVIFQNELGKLVMSESKYTNFMITKYDGLDYISPEFNSELYVNENGKRTTSKYIPARVITFQISIKNYNRIEMENAIRVLSRKGALILNNDNKVRKINCQCLNFEKGDRNAMVSVRSLQFECDKVNFEDLYPKKELLFEKVPMLEEPFTLPTIATEIVNEKDIYNLGYLVIQPIIYISNTGVSESVQPELYGFEIVNETLGEKIKLNYHTELDEIIKIDVYNREITSSKGVDLINFISSDTNLETFFYDLGKNHIKFNNYNTGENLIAYTEYSNLYIEVL